MTTPEQPKDTTHGRLPDEPAGMGCVRAVCACGDWTSAPTNRPQHLGRAYRSHKLAAKKKEEEVPGERTA